MLNDNLPQYKISQNSQTIIKFTHHITQRRNQIMSTEASVLDTSLPPSVQEKTEEKVDNIITLAEKLDFFDVQLLRKFYMTGKDFPYDTQPHCFPILFLEMKVNHKISIGSEALRKRLDNLTKIGLLEKINRSNPANYSPVKGLEQIVRAMITRFFTINGLTKFLS